MRRKRHEPVGPGNDGRWFLEAVGVVEPPPSPTSTYTQLAALDGHPTGSESADVAGVGADTTGPFDRWEPEAISPRLNRGNRGRLILLLLPVIVVGLVIAGIATIPRLIRAEASTLSSRYRSSLTDLRNELPDTQRTLGVLTDPASTTDEIGAVVPGVGELNVRATVVVSQATEPLPVSVPLVPRGPVTALEPTRSSMLILGATAQDVAGRLATTFAYRSAVPILLRTGNLPATADSSTIERLSVTLAESLADNAKVVSELPSDPSFDETRRRAIAASDRYATWQIEYLDALRRGEEDRATRLVDEMSGLRDSLAVALEEALGTVRTELDPMVVGLARDTEAAVAAIP